MARTSVTKKCTVYLNSADVDELAAVPGIGLSMAQKIVDYRDQHGPLSSLNDLRNIPGFTDRILESIEKCDVEFD